MCICEWVRDRERSGSQAHPAAMGFHSVSVTAAFPSSYCLLCGGKWCFPSRRRDSGVLCKLHFPLGRFRALCVPDSCQPSLTKLSLSHSSFSSQTHLLFCCIVCVSQELGWTRQFVQQHLNAILTFPHEKTLGDNGTEKMLFRRHKTSEQTLTLSGWPSALSRWAERNRGTDRQMHSNYYNNSCQNTTSFCWGYILQMHWDSSSVM